jgi:Na+-transporting NADH:ubiquinone oxidoreductase subunit A
LISFNYNKDHAKVKLKDMPDIIRLRKGLNIRLEGKAEKILMPEVPVDRFCIRPSDFPGLVPKLLVKEGDIVAAGATLFFDKMEPDVKYTSPVSGKILAVIRGEKRVIQGILIGQQGKENIDFGAADPLTLTREEVKKKILFSGLWPVIRQRPYHIVANPNILPKAIFISAFNTAPLAPDLEFVLSNTHGSYLQTGIDVLSRLTDGRINISFDAGGTRIAELKNLHGVERHYFSGPHPAGNPGIQIHHIDPVSKGETVWYLNIQDVVVLGKLFARGVYDHEKVIALAGPGVKKPRYYRLKVGSSLAPIVSPNIKEGNYRIIGGNVLTGTTAGTDGFLGYYDDMVSVIPEGDHNEFFGWLSPGLTKHSFWKTFISKLFPAGEYRLDTNLHGGVRTFVLTGHYEKVLPMDIYPILLLKAILAEDIDMMEKLGIYEVAEEDFALCEYIDPSKTEMQEIVRKGINLMIKEMS